MRKIRRNIEAILYGDEPEKRSFLGAVLSGVSFVYGLGVKARAGGYQKGLLRTPKLPCAVISVGNLTLGGTGKTPMTLYLARLVRKMGLRPVVISRGYKGEAEARGGVVSDGEHILMTPVQAGDEPSLMASLLDGIPVLVGRNRYQAGKTAIKAFSPDVILLDDGYQHLQLARDLNLLLLEAKRPFGNGTIFPRGPLREPLTALERADAFVLMYAGERLPADAGENEPRFPEAVRDRPVFYGLRRPVIRKVLASDPKAGKRDLLGPESAPLKGLNIFAFCGLARNAPFRRTLENWGARICGFAEFADHHWYGPQEIEALCRSAQEGSADLIATTEKDYVRIAEDTVWPVDLLIVGIEVSIEPEDRWRRFLAERLGLNLSKIFHD